MIRQVVMAAGLLGVCSGIQRWSKARSEERRRLRRVDVPRWEDEGGAPSPAATPPAGPLDLADPLP